MDKILNCIINNWKFKLVRYQKAEIKLFLRIRLRVLKSLSLSTLASAAQIFCAYQVEQTLLRNCNYSKAYPTQYCIK